MNIFMRKVRGLAPSPVGNDGRGTRCLITALRSAPGPWNLAG